MTAFDASSYEKEANDNWVPDDNKNDIDPDDFEQIYREYLDQGRWIEYENKFTLDTDNLDFVYPKNNDNTKLINTYRSLTGGTT